MIAHHLISLMSYRQSTQIPIFPAWTVSLQTYSNYSRNDARYHMKNKAILSVKYHALPSTTPTEYSTSVTDISFTDSIQIFSSTPIRPGSIKIHSTVVYVPSSLMTTLHMTPCLFFFPMPAFELTQIGIILPQPHLYSNDCSNSVAKHWVILKWDGLYYSFQIWQIVGRSRKPKYSNLILYLYTFCTNCLIKFVKMVGTQPLKTYSKHNTNTQNIHISIKFTFFSTRM